MIPNILNAVVGLFLVYAAIVAPQLITGGGASLLVAAAVIFVLAFWARRSDHRPWQNNINMALAAILAAATAVQMMGAAPDRFWSAIWIGIAVAVLSLWAALYRPQSSSGRPVRQT
jgi:hypothetical protein